MNENISALLEVVNDKIDSFDIAFQFVLEELEAASIAGKENIFLKKYSNTVVGGGQKTILCMLLAQQWLINYNKLDILFPIIFF